MAPHLALRPEQNLQIRKFVVEMRAKKPIVLVDTYYNHRGEALCPSATGLSHHISPRGELEPCPVIQFAAENIRDKASIYDLCTQSEFLRDYRETIAKATRGCVVLERPDLLKELVLRNQARDSTSRGTALAELDRMEPRSSQYMPGHEIPEKHWMYRWSKKLFFDDFGAYRDFKGLAPEGEKNIDPKDAVAHNASVTNDK